VATFTGMSREGRFRQKRKIHKGATLALLEMLAPLKVMTIKIGLL
jgi:hypothetical protein